MISKLHQYVVQVNRISHMSLCSNHPASGLNDRLPPNLQHFDREEGEIFHNSPPTRHQSFRMGKTSSLIHPELRYPVHFAQGITYFSGLKSVNTRTWPEAARIWVLCNSGQIIRLVSVQERTSHMSWICKILVSRSPLSCSRGSLTSSHQLLFHPIINFSQLYHWDWIPQPRCLHLSVMTPPLALLPPFLCLFWEC